MTDHTSIPLLDRQFAFRGERRSSPASSPRNTTACSVGPFQWVCISWLAFLYILSAQMEVQAVSDICRAPICTVGEFCSRPLPRTAKKKQKSEENDWIEFTGQGFQGTPSVAGEWHLTDLFTNDSCQVIVIVHDSYQNTINASKCDNSRHEELMQTCTCPQDGTSSCFPTFPDLLDNMALAKNEETDVNMTLFKFIMDDYNDRSGITDEAEFTATTTKSRNTAAFDLEEINKSVTTTTTSTAVPTPTPTTTTTTTTTTTPAVTTTANPTPKTTTTITTPAATAATTPAAATAATTPAAAAAATTAPAAAATTTPAAAATTTPAAAATTTPAATATSAELTTPQEPRSGGNIEKLDFEVRAGEMFKFRVENVHKPFYVTIKKMSPRTVWLFSNDTTERLVQGFTVFSASGQHPFTLRSTQDDSNLREGVLRIMAPKYLKSPNHHFITEDIARISLADTMSQISSRVNSSASIVNGSTDDAVLLLSVHTLRGQLIVEWMSRLLLDTDICSGNAHEERVGRYTAPEIGQTRTTTFVSDCPSWRRTFSHLSMILLVVLIVCIPLVSCVWAIYKPAPALPNRRDAENILYA